MSRVIYSCGANGNGQLGIGRSDVPLLPEFTQVQLPLGEEPILAIAGGYHSVAVTRSGKVFTWGMNKHGELGHAVDVMATQSVPLRVRLPATEDYPTQHKTKDGDMKIMSAAAGEAHTVLLTTTGTVLTFGANSVGQLGRPLNADEPTHQPLAVDFANSTVMLRSSMPISQVFCGPQTSFAVTPSGHLFGWGGSTSGELGITQPIVATPRPITLPSSLHHTYKVVRVAAGCAHTLLMTSTGECFVAGDNSEGQLGIGSVSSSPHWRGIRHAKNLRAIATNNSQSFFLTQSGIISECGTASVKSVDPSSTPKVPMTTPDLIYDLTGVEFAGATAAGNGVLLWTAGGEIYVRGTNHRGQLGIGQVAAIPSFTKISKSKLDTIITKDGKYTGGRLTAVSLGKAHTLALFACKSMSNSNLTESSSSGVELLKSPTDDSSPEFPTFDAGGLDVNSSSDEHDLAARSNTGELNKSCIDDVMNLSFSRSRAPAQSFAAANGSRPMEDSPKSKAGSPLGGIVVVSGLCALTAAAVAFVLTKRRNQ